MPYFPPPPLGPNASIVICQANSPGAIGASATKIPFDTFYNVSGTMLGTGSPTDAAVIAALATLGMSVSSDGKTFTLAQSGLYALRLDVIPVIGPTTHACSVYLLAGASGFTNFWGPTFLVPAGSANTQGFGTGYTDVLLTGDAFSAYQKGTNAETDLGNVGLALVRVR